ncbi:alcohol oxidase [Rhodocollybia butyracea]|uniref:Alcohol oxidase n=1 Tax=Rhodocollybia butyracea TaxID=206335 RepID=A0A9P5PHS2_9AGAR|nr:alcohol oxidase [Rhodocollybia butyracea]
MTIGARLSENTNLTIGILEAGGFRIGDPLIDVPGLAGEAAGNPLYDWNFDMVPQTHAAGRVIAIPRGKLLGGSSALNLMAWNRGSSEEYNAWEQIAPGNGWDWDGLLPFFKKSEDILTVPGDPYPGITPAEARNASEHASEFEGFTGPVVASHNIFYPDPVPAFVKTVNAMNFSTNAQPLSGSTSGVWNTLCSVDRTQGFRSYAARAYFCDQPTKPNLHILLGASVAKVVFVNTTLGLSATQVEFIVNSTTHTANAKKEIILSAGTLKTPQVLELSGIGNATHLHSLNIEPLVDLPGVGENLQEHPYVPAQWQLKPGFLTFDILRNNKTFFTEQFALYNRTGTGLLTDLDTTVIFSPLQAVVDSEQLVFLENVFDNDTRAQTLNPLEQLQFPIQRSWLRNGVVPDAEIILWSRGEVNPAINESYIFMLGGMSHPLSRGSVHINSTNSLIQPIIDINFLGQDYDALFLVNALKFLFKIAQQPPLSELIDFQTDPNPSMMSDDELLQFVRETVAGGDHEIGTAAMAPREHGGVVDPFLKVYGTTNLRVADASIFPLHIGHTQATVYAIGEKLSTMILASENSS